MDIQLTQVLFQIVNVSVVVGALTYFLYKPILKIFDERALRIEEGQKAAAEALATRDELESAKKKMESELKKERAQILTEAQEEAKKRADEIVSRAKKEAKDEHAKLLSNWEKERVQLLKESKKDITDAIIAVSSKVIAQSLDTKAQQKVIDTELDAIFKQV